MRGRFKQPETLGVTLLEILLVLTISASILLMSVRYYQSATYSLQANSILQQIQSLTATIDNFSAGTTYAWISVSALNPILPPHSLTTPWGTDITLEAGTNSYEVTLHDTPSPVCYLIRTKLESNNHYKIPAPCAPSVADFSYTYVANA